VFQISRPQVAWRHVLSPVLSPGATLRARLCMARHDGRRAWCCVFDERSMSVGGASAALSGGWPRKSCTLWRDGVRRTGAWRCWLALLAVMADMARWPESHAW